MADQLTFLIWESEIKTTGPGSVTLTARRPLSVMTVRQAARVLGVSPWTVQNLYQARLLEGYKPGARVVRKDGRASNATIQLDSGSVLEYKQRQQEMARKEREA